MARSSRRVSFPRPLLLALACVVSAIAPASAQSRAAGDAACAAPTSEGSSSSSAEALASLVDVYDLARATSEYVIKLRRELHLHPELMWTETKTSALVKRELDLLGASHVEISPPGVVATIGDGASPVVLLRADMDALPMREESAIPPNMRSTRDGVMHACGHDGHVAMLLGAAKVLTQMAEMGSLPPGTVRLAFQPAEEGGAGARRMLEDGLDDLRPPTQSSFALHNWPYPETPSGVVGTRGGTIMAGSGSFEIAFTGAGGHAAVPHKNADVVVCGANAVIALQTIVSRLVDPLDSAVVSVTVFQAGGAASNVMGDVATLRGTFRALSKKTFEWLHQAITKIVVSTATAHGCAVNVEYFPVSGGVRHEEYPPTVNDVDAAKFAAGVGAAMFGADAVVDVEPVMPAEDFSFFAERWPSAMMWLGSYNVSAGATHALHSTKYVLDESVLHRGVAMHAGYAVAFLKNGGKFA